MVGRSWMNPAQLAFLKSKLTDYITRHAQNRIPDFRQTLEEDWFSSFPEEAELRLPQPGAQNARELTEEEKIKLQDAIVRRKKQLIGWFRREHRKTRTNTGKSTPRPGARLLKVFAGKLRKEKAHRPRRGVEVFQRRNRNKIIRALKQRGYDKLNEATRCLDTSTHQETLDEQRKHVKSARSARTTMRNKVVAELWDDASDEERAAVERVMEEERRRHSTQKEAEKNGGQGASRSPAEYQDAIDGVEGLITEVHRLIQQDAGWTVMTLAVGPMPRYGGDLALKVICSGETAAGNNFRATYADFDKNICGPFSQFGQRAFPIGIRDARALPASSDEVAAVEVLRVCEEEESPLPRHQRRVRGRGKKTTDVGATTPSAPTPATVSAPALFSPPEAPLSPAAPSEDYTFQSFATDYTLSSLAADDPLTSLAGDANPHDVSLPLHGVYGDTLSLNGDSTSPLPSTGSLVPLWSSPSMMGRSAAEIPSEWWASDEAQEWGMVLGQATMSRSSWQDDELPALPLPSPTIARPKPRPMYKGSSSSAQDDDPCTISAFSTLHTANSPPTPRAGPRVSRYAPSGLFSAFHSGRSSPSPTSTDTSPVSIRRKQATWAGAVRAHRTAGYSSLTAKSMSALVGGPSWLPHTPLPALNIGSTAPNAPTIPPLPPVPSYTATEVSVPPLRTATEAATEAESAPVQSASAAVPPLAWHRAIPNASAGLPLPSVLPSAASRVLVGHDVLVSSPSTPTSRPSVPTSLECRAPIPQPPPTGSCPAAGPSPAPASRPVIAPPASRPTRKAPTIAPAPPPVASESKTLPADRPQRGRPRNAVEQVLVDSTNDSQVLGTMADHSNDTEAEESKSTRTRKRTRMWDGSEFVGPVKKQKVAPASQGKGKKPVAQARKKAKKAPAKKPKNRK